MRLVRASNVKWLAVVNLAALAILVAEISCRAIAASSSGAKTCCDAESGMFDHADAPRLATATRHANFSEFLNAPVAIADSSLTLHNF